MEIIEPHWDNGKSHLKVLKEKKVKFEDYVTDMETEINHIF